MRPHILLTYLLLLLGIAPAGATTGTCTTSDVLVKSLGLQWRVPAAAGIALGVEFDEAAGTFTLDRHAWFERFGENGVQFPVPPGPNGWLVFFDGQSPGTIDRDGNVRLPAVPLAFATDFIGNQRSQNLPISPDLSTNSHFRTVSGRPEEAKGVPIDFNTGMLTIEGGDILPDAPGAPGALITTVRLTCQLNPIPDATKLPTAPAVTKLNGLAKIGKPLAEGSANAGDSLKLKMKLARWPSTLDLESDEVYLRVGADTTEGPTDLVILRVESGMFEEKRNAQVVSDNDGSVVGLLVGQKKEGELEAAKGGSIKIVSGSRATNLVAKVHGLDLSALSGEATVTVNVGALSSTAAVSVRGTGKKRRLKLVPTP